MKNVKYLFATIVLGICLTSCGDSFLTTPPEGEYLSSEQFGELPNNLQGSISGIYSQMYAYGGEHDYFGHRAIDMYGDIQSGDMAMKTSNYGWFEAYERGYFYAYARSYMWGYYYGILSSVNASIKAIEGNIPTIIESIGSTGTIGSNIVLQGYYYGQILAMRGYVFSNLLRYYCDPMDQLQNPKDQEKSIPMYTEENIDVDLSGAKRATVDSVYKQIYKDLSTAIAVLDFYGPKNTRGSKLEIDADVARLLLAYALLNYCDDDVVFAEEKTASKLALDLADAAIKNGKYKMLKKEDLLTTGFMDVTAANWMWGEDVTVDNTTALASFFGQVDIHTYSYACAGDTKAIDANLYKEITNKKWDKRAKWFRSGSDKSFPYCPDGKFYCPKTKHTTDLDSVDGDWLCDHVYMRIELAYLIAAEAAWRIGEEATSVQYLRELCNERVIDGKESDLETWLSGLSSDALKDALIYNWRVEMWGEGYGLQTLRRLSKTVTLGSNHLSRAGQTIDMSNKNDRISCQCEIPTSESTYNPNLVRRRAAIPTTILPR